jgi:hypothetical protein
VPGAAPALVTVASTAWRTRSSRSRRARARGARRPRRGCPELWRASETAHSSSLEGAARGGALAAAAILAQPAVAPARVG